VIVSAVDDVDDPRFAEIYYFPADEVRQRLETAHKARTEHGERERVDFGVWIALDRQDGRSMTVKAGAGIAEDYPPIGRMPLDANDRPAATTPNLEPHVIGDARTVRSIAQIKAAAAIEIATIAGVAPDKVRIDIRILD
jgi:hypothetical protein